QVTEPSSGSPALEIDENGASPFGRARADGLAGHGAAGGGASRPHPTTASTNTTSNPSLIVAHPSCANLAEADRGVPLEHLREPHVPPRGLRAPVADRDEGHFEPRLRT